MTDVQRVCAHGPCPNVVKGRRPQAKYCDDSCKWAASKARRGDDRPNRSARVFWAGYGRHVRRRPTLRTS